MAVCDNHNCMAGMHTMSRQGCKRMLGHLQKAKRSSLTRRRGGKIPQAVPSRAESRDALQLEDSTPAMSLQPGVLQQALQAQSGSGVTEASESSRMQLLPARQSLIPTSSWPRPAGC